MGGCFLAQGPLAEVFVETKTSGTKKVETDPNEN